MNQYEPDQHYVIEDNIESMRLIVDQGCLEMLKPMPGDSFAAFCFET